jgi:sugar lactone lactonase YvrE
LHLAGAADMRDRMKTKTLVDGLAFGEGPRWHDGKLWFSDMHARWIMTVDLAGRTERIIEVPNLPSGLGWLPDGRLLVVSMRDRQLLQLDGKKLTSFADLSKLASFDCNDMVVARACVRRQLRLRLARQRPPEARGPRPRDAGR